MKFFAKIVNAAIFAKGFVLDVLQGIRMWVA